MVSFCVEAHMCCMFVWACLFNLNSAMIVFVTCLQMNVFLVLLVCFCRASGCRSHLDGSFYKFFSFKTGLLKCFFFFFLSQAEERASLVTGIPVAIFSLMPSLLGVTHSKFFPVIMNIAFWPRAAGKELGSVKKKKKRKWSKLNETKVHPPKREVNKVRKRRTLDLNPNTEETMKFW